MRTFALATILLCTPAMAQTITVTNGPIARPLPKFVQELADDDYQIWVDWQNRQAAARAAEKSLPDFPELPYRRVMRETSSSYAAHRTANVTISSATSLKSGRNGGSSRSSGNSHTYGRGLATAGSVRDIGPAYYHNPAYTGPGALTVYNPYCRSSEGVGSPDWDNLFIPTQDGTTRTLGEELQKRGPVDPEALYRELFTPYY